MPFFERPQVDSALGSRDFLCTGLGNRDGPRTTRIAAYRPGSGQPQGEGGGGKTRRERSTAQHVSRPWWMKKNEPHPRSVHRWCGSCALAGLRHGPRARKGIASLPWIPCCRRVLMPLATAATGDFDAQSVTAQLLLTASPRVVPHRWAAQRRTGSLSQASRLGVVMTFAPA